MVWRWALDASTGSERVASRPEKVAEVGTGLYRGRGPLCPLAPFVGPGGSFVAEGVCKTSRGEDAVARMSRLSHTVHCEAMRYGTVVEGVVDC